MGFGSWRSGLRSQFCLHPLCDPRQGVSFLWASISSVIHWSATSLQDYNDDGPGTRTANKRSLGWMGPVWSTLLGCGQWIAGGSLVSHGSLGEGFKWFLQWYLKEERRGLVGSWCWIWPPKPSCSSHPLSTHSLPSPEPSLWLQHGWEAGPAPQGALDPAGSGLMKMGLNAARPNGKDPGCVLRDSLDLCHTGDVLL